MSRMSRVRLRSTLVVTTSWSVALFIYFSFSFVLGLARRFGHRRSHLMSRTVVISTAIV
jgi:hypothetical protein